MASRRNRGELSREDAAIWRRVTDTIRATRPFPDLLNDPGPTPEPVRPKPRRKPTEDAAPAPAKPAPKAADDPQLDGRTADRLRRGRIEPERSIDLHGLTLNIAEEMLRRFVDRSRRDGLKVVLVITGKGRRAPEADDEIIPTRRRGVIRESLPMWITSGSLKGMVLKAVPAHPRHGGAGAWYLYLKRSRKPGSPGR